MVESNKHKKIAVFFATVLRPRHGNTEQFHRSDSYARLFEMKVGDLAAVEIIRLHDRLKLLKILSAFVRRPFVRLVLITGGLTNAGAERRNSKQTNQKRPSQNFFQKPTTRLLLGIRHRLPPALR